MFYYYAPKRVADPDDLAVLVPMYQLTENASELANGEGSRPHIPF